MNNNEKLVNETVRLLNEEYNNIHKLNEMASTGPAYKGYRFFVYGNEGSYPHTHIVKNKETICCIRLDCVDYFHKEKYPKCDSTLRNIIVEYLNQPYRKASFNINNWQYLVQAWNNDNQDKQMNEELLMPDYRKLEVR